MKKQALSSQQKNNTQRGLSLSYTTSITSTNSSQGRSFKGSLSSEKHHSLSLPFNTKHSHSRPKSPTPSDLSTGTTLNNYRHPAEMTQRSASPVQMSPRSSISSLGRSDSYSRKNAHHSRKISDDYRRYNGTVNHYGRHSNDWLFGGFSLRDTVRGGVERLRNHRHGNDGWMRAVLFGVLRSTTQQNKLSAYTKEQLLPTVTWSRAFK